MLATSRSSFEYKLVSCVLTQSAVLGLHDFKQDSTVFPERTQEERGFAVGRTGGPGQGRAEGRRGGEVWVQERLPL